ncbi:tetratricopeptide repeat protein [bacterium]|nr:tetratricopeptide repeat protein [bacterium]MBU1989676.1 tetratricopeptide repeat protein [bacterium]
MKIFLTILLTLCINSAIFAADKKAKDEIDSIALATVLLKDGYYSRAHDALNNVDLEDAQLDKAQYYTLMGLVKSKLLQYEESNKNFYLAIQNGQSEKSIYIYIAQNSFKLQKYDEAVEALENARELVDKTPKLAALKAECFYRLKEYESALSTLKELNRLHPKYYDAYRQRFVYLVSLGLYQSALDDAEVYMKNAEPNEKVTLSFINALRKSKQTTKAIVLAENAHLMYSKNATITVLLASLYIDKDMIQAAADLFDQASLQDEKYIKDSSEMFRRAKEYIQALYKNSQILDSKEKYKQKIAIYLEFGNYEKVVSAKDALDRNGLLKEQNIMYALAYSYYMIGDFQSSEKYLKMITRSDLFQKAVELRKNMNKCKNNPWECTL